MSQQLDHKPGVENDFLNDGVAVFIARMLPVLPIAFTVSLRQPNTNRIELREHTYEMPMCVITGDRSAWCNCITVNTAKRFYVLL